MNKSALRSLFSALLLAASILSAESSAQVKMLEKPDEVFLKKNAGKRGGAADN